MFFRILLLFLLFYLLVRLVQSFFQPKVRQPYSTQNNNEWYKSNRKEGETSIQNIQPNKTKKIPKNEGDYIDYEDV